MATIAAIRYKTRHPTVLTFGSPRVGNQAFYSYYKNFKIPTDRVVRVFRERLSVLMVKVNRNDLVPHLPPKLIGYHHVASEYWYIKNLTYLPCNGSGEDPGCSASVPPFNFSLNDHGTYLGIDLTIGSKFGC